MRDSLGLEVNAEDLKAQHGITLNHRERDWPTPSTENRGIELPTRGQSMLRYIFLWSGNVKDLLLPAPGKPTAGIVVISFYVFEISCAIA